MKLTVRTLSGSRFSITAQPHDTILAVKKYIEEVQGENVYPSARQMLIHGGKVLNDQTTLTEINISKDGCIVVMLSKAVPNAAPALNVSSVAKNPPAKPPISMASIMESVSSLGNRLDFMLADEDREIRQIVFMGGGRWDAEAVQTALRYANDDFDLAVHYLETGILVNTEAYSTSGAPNSSPLNLFPQVAVSGAARPGAGPLGFLRNKPELETLRSLVQENPQILEPLLQELGKKNPYTISLIQKNNQEFLQLLNVPVDGSKGDISDQVEEEMPRAVNVTPAEQESIERIVAMGFDRALVLEAFSACERNEELTLNYLLENFGDK